MHPRPRVSGWRWLADPARACPKGANAGLKPLEETRRRPHLTRFGPTPAFGTPPDASAPRRAAPACAQRQLVVTGCVGPAGSTPARGSSAGRCRRETPHRRFLNDGARTHRGKTGGSSGLFSVAQRAATGSGSRHEAASRGAEQFATTGVGRDTLPPHRHAMGSLARIRRNRHGVALL